MASEFVTPWGGRWKRPKGEEFGHGVAEKVLALTVEAFAW